MSSIIRETDTFHGISVFGRGMFTDEFGFSYAGQCKDGYACGLGVYMYSDGYKEYAEHGPTGSATGGAWAAMPSGAPATACTSAASRRSTHTCSPTAAARTTTWTARRTIRACLR